MAEKGFELDDIDKRIITLIQKRPEVSQSKIGKLVNLSQPAVSARIAKLKKNGILSYRAGIDARKAGFQVLEIEAVALGTKEVLSTFRDCPYFLGSMVLSGKNNLCLFFLCEDSSTIESLVTRHLRGNPQIKSLDMCTVLGSTFDIFYSMSVSKSPTKQNPCGATCEGCEFYAEGRCVGCPASVYYRGKIFAR